MEEKAEYANHLEKQRIESLRRATVERFGERKTAAFDEGES